MIKKGKRKVNLTGMRFGKLTVIKRVNNNKYGHYQWECKCDCGNTTTVLGQSLRSGRTVSCRCIQKMRGPEGAHWRGGRCRSGGYILLLLPDHPNAKQHSGRDQGSIYVPEHVKVMADKLGRPLRKGEIVHHKNGVKDDNRPENLELWTRAHPNGKRVEDLVEFSMDVISWYPEIAEEIRKRRTQ